MIGNTQPTPPRLAQAFLRASLRAADSESVPGDLLEEYREVQWPSLGKFRADIWYIKHVVSVAWHMMWPFIVSMIALRILSFPLPARWNPSLFPAPGVSLLDAVIFLLLGYYSSQRTGRIRSGILNAAALSILAFTTFFVYAAATQPSLLVAPFEKPFIFVIVASLLAIAMSFGIALGILGAVAGRWTAPLARKRRFTS